MNRDDRAALIEMGRQFCPELFGDLDAGEVKDDAVLGLVGNAFSVLYAAAQEERSLGSEAQTVADDQPTFAEVEAWLAQQPLLVTQQHVRFTEQPGGRRRRLYSATQEPATMADVLSWRLDEAGALLHVVLCDGQLARLPWP